MTPAGAEKASSATMNAVPLEETTSGAVESAERGDAETADETEDGDGDGDGGSPTSATPLGAPSAALTATARTTFKEEWNTATTDARHPGVHGPTATGETAGA